MTTPAPIPAAPVPDTPVSGAAPTPPMPPPAAWKVIAVVGGIVTVTAAVVVALWWAGTAGLNGDKLVTARLDALRTGLSIGIGGGGALALYLSWRRQRAAEVTLAQAATALAQKDRDHDHAESDARERRITDLYAKAVEQLGSDKAPVRLGGLYALERLAQDNPPQRQTIVNVLCAYLRMPYTLPDDQLADDADVSLLDARRVQVQEREVRLTAQRILADHLRPGSKDIPVVTFWPGINLDLTDATLIDLDFASAVIRTAIFAKARFSGTARFHKVKFAGVANFEMAQFNGQAWFFDVQFNGKAQFAEVKFDLMSQFTGTQFGDEVWFFKAQFRNGITFAKARFDRHAVFHSAQFDGVTQFAEVEFNRGFNFSQANFDKARIVGSLPGEIERYVLSSECVIEHAASEIIADVDREKDT